MAKPDHREGTRNVGKSQPKAAGVRIGHNATHDEDSNHIFARLRRYVPVVDAPLEHADGYGRAVRDRLALRASNFGPR